MTRHSDSQPPLATRAAIYVRISSDPQGLKAGVQRQEADCRGYCKRRGWEVADVYVDNDVSAYSGKPRPAYRRMLDDLMAAKAQALVVWHPDRLHRSPRELEDFIDVIEVAGTSVVSVTAGDYDLSTPEGRLTARIVGSVARKESEDKSRRSLRKHLELAQAGKLVGGGTRPYGYNDDRVTIREDEACHVREAAGRVLAGMTVRSICADWNERGVTTVTGKQWHPHVLGSLLASARIAGLREHRGQVTAQADWLSIIDRQTHTLLRSVLRDPNRLKRKMPARRYLLTGIATCGLCGAKLVARPRQDRVRCYVCARGPGFKGCGKIRSLAEPLDDLIREAVLAAIDSPALTEALGSGDRDEAALRALAEELTGFQDRLARLEHEYAVEGLWDRPTFLRQRSELEGRIDSLRREVANQRHGRFVADLPPGIDAVLEWWKGSSIDDRRTLCSVVIEKVVVNSAVRGRNRFDPNRIDVIWRA